MNFFRKLKASIAADRTYRGADGARAYAIGDVHGRLDLLDRMLQLIGEDIAARPHDNVYIVMLGDLIDRGPDSARVIERLRTFDDFAARLVFLLGNHEEIMLRVLAAEPGLAYDWMAFGGDACLQSYGVSAREMAARDEPAIAERLERAVPAEHIAFIKQFGDTFQFGDYLFVHAGIRPGVAIDEQNPHDLRWIRRPFLSDTSDHGLIVVHGHTMSDEAEVRTNRIGIDTGAYHSSVLTALAVEDDQRWFLSTAP
jgi:serine/threonine protein phosphatase 1